MITLIMKESNTQVALPKYNYCCDTGNLLFIFTRKNYAF